MADLFSFYESIRNDGIDLVNHSLLSTKSVTICHEKYYGIILDVEKLETWADELCTVAHEYGHCATGTTHTVYSSLELVVKHEYKANKWAVHKLIPFDDLQEAWENGYIEVWELAEYFSVTEGFVRTAIYIYQREGKIRD